MKRRAGTMFLAYLVLAVLCVRQGAWIALGICVFLAACNLWTWLSLCLEKYWLLRRLRSCIGERRYDRNTFGQGKHWEYVCDVVEPSGAIRSGQPDDRFSLYLWDRMFLREEPKGKKE